MGVLLELVGELGCSIELADLDQRLDCIRVHGVDRPFAKPRLAEHRGKRLQCFSCRLEIAEHELEVTERPELVREPDRPLDRAGVVDARAQDAAGLLDPAKLHRHEPARVPLRAALAPELPVEVNELGRVGLCLPEVSGSDLELDQMKNAAGGRTNPSQVDGQLQQLAESRSRARQLPGVEEPKRELELWRLVGLADARKHRLSLDRMLEELLVEAPSGEERRRSELAGR